MAAGRLTRERCKTQNQEFVKHLIMSLVLCRESWLFRYAMKCLDKKRIKMKQGETLALNERQMLSLVSTGVSRIHQTHTSLTGLVLLDRKTVLLSSA